MNVRKEKWLLVNHSLEYIKILEEVENNDGEITDEIAELLTMNPENAKERIANFAGYIREQEAEISACKKEQERLASIIQSKNNTIVSIKKLILQAVILYGEKGKTGNHSLKWETGNAFTRNNETVDIYDEGKIPLKYAKASLSINAENHADIIQYLNENNPTLAKNLSEAVKAYAVDKVNIKKDLKANVEIPGAVLKKEESIIIIK